ncbi:MAG: single-stranded DNA-binding protein [Candidatus Caldatribacterium sp.]|uniref:single-stranded DNA-binding protein n=1 Tax=Candidatus Caldatribacterium sp. TaxID=2282143 RepID=UPI00299C59E3|nr:single-stranded DNA-binding protein [Candidatus Caldatribacterium sp.]MCX7731434.1 single-stranded DNA-binding protein [Candidatus Caldatribacterium sp.]MDW8081518.1 single-stranded DNA-binding protein [Candidatus Calescibacterium sp.]
MARSDINYFFGIGNLTKDPELRYTPQGTPVCRFRMAMNRRYQGKSGPVEEVTYITVAAWAKLAELCARYLHKGSRVAVVGSLRSSSWEDRNGGKRTSYEIRAESIQFLSTPRGVISDEDVLDLSPEIDMENFATFAGEESEAPLGDLEDIPPQDNEVVEDLPF